MPRSRALVAATALVLATSACGSGSGADSGGDDGKVTVATSFYPLEYAVQQIGGEHVAVTNLTKAGAEPHDLELTPQQVLAVSETEHLIYLKQFQPSVDDVAKEVGDRAFDVSADARLDLPSAEEEGHEGESPEEHAEHAEEEGHEGESPEEHAEHAEEGHDHGAKDPHFWLDPTRYADVADGIAERLAKGDPEHAADYRENAEAFRNKLTDLDKELRTGLADCTQTDLVTGHSAFAYFADRYGFHQESVSGLTPGAQPSPAAMAELIKQIKKEKITTVYAETLVPTDVAETIARDAGAKVSVLDPVAGLTDASAGNDYFEIMRSNLAAVQKGQDCR